MNPDQSFGVAGNVAIAGWLLLLASLVAPLGWRARLRFVGGRVLPALLAAGYVAALLVWWPEAHGRGGFGSLGQVAQLFAVPGLLLAGWVHYLAFDLLVGRWQIDDAAARGVAGVAAWWLWPCLVLTFFFGPAGWLLYLLSRTLATTAAASKRKPSP